MILLPLIVLGIERLVHNGKGALYTGALAVLQQNELLYGLYGVHFLSSALLGLLPMTKPRPEKSAAKAHHSEKLYKIIARHPFLNRCVRFAGFSLLAGGLCAVTLLPTYFLLRGTLPPDSFPPLLSLTLPFLTFNLPPVRPGDHHSLQRRRCCLISTAACCRCCWCLVPH